MVEPQSSKLMVRVRFPSSPPNEKATFGWLFHLEGIFPAYFYVSVSPSMFRFPGPTRLAAFKANAWRLQAARVGTSPQDVPSLRADVRNPLAGRQTNAVARIRIHDEDIRRNDVLPLRVEV